MFKGYVRTNNKKSMENIKNRNKFKTYEEIKDYEEFAGVLDQDTILVDIDDKLESDVLFKIVVENNLKCKVYETRRGKHFYFKNNKIQNNKTGTKLAVGLTADIKLGRKNSYGILKYENKERAVLLDTEELQELPIYLYPTNSEVTFLGMCDGDCRNTALYTYIPLLESDNFLTNEIRLICEIINKYVFKTPLPDGELRVILRDESFGKPRFHDGKKFNHDIFARHMMTSCNIKRINGQLHTYKNGVYSYDYRFIEREMVNILPQLTDSKRKEVLKYLEITCDDYELSSSRLVAFKNGVYDLEKDELLPLDPNYIITNIIPWNFNS